MQFDNVTFSGVSIVPPSNMTSPSAVDYLVVAGGGGGAGIFGGGGGGGLLTATGYSVTSGSPITVTVGAGGAGTPLSGDGRGAAVNGNDSVFGTITTKGGGYGTADQIGKNGGSGGGGGGWAWNGYAGGKGIYPGSSYLSQARQGYDGGSGSTSNGGGGGGGGASAV